MRQFGFWTLALLFLGVSTQVSFAQSDPNDPDQFEYTEWHKKTEKGGASRLTVFGSDIMGDRIDPHMGSLSFSQTDVSIPGNSGLQVAINRTRSGGLAYRYDVEVEFGDWELSTPRIQTISLAGPWTGNRCSSDYDVTLPDDPNLENLTNTKYSNGVMVKTGGNSQQMLENPPGDQWPASATHVTLQNWYFTCLNNIRGGGQGFLGHAPNGDIYRFDRFFSRNHYGLMGKYSPVARSQNIIAATRVTDVHGNTVNYNYDSLNRLTSITSSDQRTITLGYTGTSQLIRTVSANGRTWDYSYSPSTYTEVGEIELTPVAHTAVLRSVELPDHGANGSSGWQFDIDGMTAGPGPGILCQQQSRTLTITHPHGTVGTFELTELQHRQDITKLEPERHCPGLYRTGDIIETGGQQTFVAAAYAVMGVTSKTLSGNDFDDIVWSYAYEQDRTPRPIFSISAPNNGLPDWSERTNWTKVTAPDGQIMTYTHYWIGAAADGYPGDHPGLGGKLKRLEVSASDGTVLKTTDTEYVLESSIGSTFAHPNPTATSLRSPSYAVKTVIGQNGDTFTSEQDYNSDHSAADYSYGKPVEQRSWGNYVISNESNKRITTTTYEHKKTGTWILNLPKTVTRNGRLLNTKEYSDAGQIEEVYQYGHPTAVATYSYNPFDGTVASITDAEGRVTQADNWKRGKPQRVTRAAGTTLEQFIERDIDDNGWLDSFTDVKNNTTTYQRDNMGRLTRVTPFTPSTGYKLVDTIITYDFAGGGAIQTVKQGPRHDIVEYDSLFRPVLEQVYNLSNQERTYTNTAYDGLNRVIFKSFPSTNPLSLIGATSLYDALGRIKETSDTVNPADITTHEYLDYHRHKITDPEGNAVTTYQYGWDGPDSGVSYLIRQHGTTDTWVRRNVHGQIWRVDQTGTLDGVYYSELQHFYYDSQQRLCRTRTPEGGDTAYQYDLAGQLTTYAKGLSARGYCYAPSGNSTVNLTYDELGRLEETLFTDSATPDIRREYDISSNLTKLVRGENTNDEVLWDYIYDDYDRLTNENLTIPGASQGYDIWHRYNAFGHLFGKRLPSGKYISYTNDGLGRATKVSSGSATYAENASYHPSGALATMTYGNGNVFTQTLNSQLQPQRLKVTNNGTDIQNLYYDYYADGRIKHRLDYVDSTYSAIHFYDAAGRLEQANSAAWGQVDYSYDPLGNLRKKEFNNNGAIRTVTNNYDTNNRIIQSIDTANINYGFNHDARGNVTKTGLLDFTYDMSDQPVAMSGTAPNTSTNIVSASYLYDGNMKRVRSIIDTGSGPETIYNVYDSSGQLVHVDEITNGEETDYLHGMGQTIARIEDGVFTYLHPDHLGSPHTGTAEDGTLAWNEYYTPFGEALMSNAANDNQAGYTGHIKDKSTGLNYMQARYYDPNIGRFLSIDPVGFLEAADPAYFNRYAYTANDPINAIDPTGEWFASKLKELGNTETVKKAAGAIAQGVNAAQQDPESFKDGVGKGMLNGGANTINGAVTLGEFASPSLKVGQLPDIPTFEQGSNQAENFGMVVGEVGAEVAMIAAAPEAILVKAPAVMTRVGKGIDFALEGGEITFRASKLRIAPFGNRTGHRTGRYPHYHIPRLNDKGKVRRGQSKNRHRPWDSSVEDNSFWDRF